YIRTACELAADGLDRLIEQLGSRLSRGHLSHVAEHAQPMTGDRRRITWRAHPDPVVGHSAQGSSTSSSKLRGAMLGRGCGCCAVGAARGPSLAVTRNTRWVWSSSVMVRAPALVFTV